MGDVLIPDLQLGNLSVTLCVRASRFWDFCDPNDESRLLHCDMVLLDEEGNSIHGTIYPPFIDKFRPLIKEGSVYNIKYFRVRLANNFYKPVVNDNMVNFTNWTKLEEVIEVPPAFPVLTYNLTPIEQLHSRVDVREYYTDAIGIVDSVSIVASHRPRGQQAPSLKRTISICNESGASVNVVLWGAQATLFPGEQLYKDGQNSPQIVVFVGTLVKKYADGLCLSGYSPCKWYINPDIPEASALMASAQRSRREIKWNEVLTSNQPASSVAEEQKVSYIKYLHPFEDKNREFLVTITIKKVDHKWWYNSCRKCSHTAVAHADSFKCTNRECGSTAVPNPRYKLLVTAGDETADADFVLFGRMAQRIIKKPCDVLIASTPVGFIPDAITRLLEKAFVWNVSLSGHTINTEKVCFQVNSIVREIATGDALIPSSPAGSQQSSLVLSHAGSSSVDTTPQTADTFESPPSSLAPQSDVSIEKDKIQTSTGATPILATDSSSTKEQKYTSRKRTSS